MQETMDTNSSDGRQLDQQMPALEEELAKMVEVLQGIGQKKDSKLEADVQQKLNDLLPKVEEQLANQSASSTSYKPQAQLPPSQTSSLPAIASSSSSSSSLNILSTSTPADNFQAPSMQPSCHESEPFTRSKPQAQLSPTQASSVSAVASSFYSSPAMNVLPASIAADNSLASSMQLSSHQSTPSTHFKPQAQSPSPPTSSLQAIASSSNFPSVLNVLPSSSAAGNPPQATDPSMELASHQNAPLTHTTPQAELSPAQDSSLPAIDSSSNSSSALHVVPASTASGNHPASANQVSLTSRGSSGSILEVAEKGDLEALHFFLAAGEEVNEQDESGNTALHYAAANGHTEFAFFLIANKAEVNCGHSRTPLHWAAVNGHAGMVALLVGAGATVDAQDDAGTTALGLAAFEGHEAVVQYLLNQGASIHIADDNGETPLFLAVKYRRRGAVKLLLKNGASPTTQNYELKSPLSVASAGGHVDILEDLLENVKPSEREEIARSLSVAGSGEVVRIFAVAAQDIVWGPAGEEALFALAREGRQQALEALLQLGVNVNATNPHGITGLHYAAVRGHSSCVQTLLQAGAQVNAKDELGRTPLHLASNNGCIMVLKESGAV